MSQLAATELDRFADLVYRRRDSSESHSLMPTSSLPVFGAEDLRAACCDLATALWANDLSPSDIARGASAQHSALTIRIDLPRPDRMTPDQQLAKTRQFLHRHNVRAKVEHCPYSYPRQAITFATVNDVRLFTALIVARLTAPDTARYRLRRAADAVGVSWYSTIRSVTVTAPTLWPSDLSPLAVHTLYRALVPQLAIPEFDPEDDEAVEEMLDAFTQALADIAVDCALVRTAPYDVHFSGLDMQAANRLADALSQHTDRIRVSLAVSLHGEKAS
ncbi:hypothetical protein N4G70_32155 [Streptomyces sp. ASQP_92]|uniref:hypothetical protein n=1 Tax=Streptomyces sp. ASQP_92 TaxID=2979116 RepID=UPI0021BFCF3B|nr:hypothetical protein [Streptomyces sp. ASQP_92]MCT9093487.1 hypothetical protein [Streptomyces sp. ASQP_92]